MRYVVVIDSCGYKGSDTEYEHFNSLMEAWSFYKNAHTYYYAGNDYYKVEKPFLAGYDNAPSSGENNHHFYTPERCRITKVHNLKNGYVYDKEFGEWILTKEEETINLFPLEENDLPF